MYVLCTSYILQKSFDILYIFCYNFRGHHILLFLAQTVARQTNEQLQYVPNRNSTAESTKSRSGSNVRGKVHSVTPPIDHELEPPKFAKTSLSHILKNWIAVKSMVMFGCNATGSRRLVFVYKFTHFVNKYLLVYKSLFVVNCFIVSWFRHSVTKNIIGKN